MNLIAKSIPPVSREFVKELRARFKPFDVRPGFDRDSLMQSVGEQRIINWIAHQARDSVMKSTLDTQEVKEEPKVEVIVPEAVEEKSNWFKKFTSRFGQ